MNDAIYLLRDLLTVGPYLLYVIIDGLHVLDTIPISRLLDIFLEALCSAAHMSDKDRPRTIKILFTTDGLVEALTSLELDEKLDALDFANEDDGSVDVDGMDVSFL